MIITSPFSSLPSFTTTTATARATITNTTSPSMSSTLSANDRSLIEFTRCLYKAKAIVNELEAFSTKVMPILLMDQEQYLRNNSNNARPDFTNHVDFYLGESFNRFQQMCNALLIVLKKLESRDPMRRESISSFHNEILKEWHRAELIKKELMEAIKQHKITIGNNNNNDIYNNQTSSDSDNDTSIDCQSETSPEPNSSESY